MAKPLKIFLSVVGALIALIVIIAGVAIATFDPNDYRDTIETTVEDATGREFTMAGDLRLSVFPWLGVETNDVTLANAEGFEPGAFAQVGQFGVSVKLLPLLDKQIQIGTVRLDGMRLNLARKADGTTNWDDLVAPPEGNEEEPAPAEPDTPPTTDSGFELGGLAVEAVEITDASVHWNDAASGQDVRLEAFRLSTGRIAPTAANPIPVTSAFKVQVAEPRTELTIDLVTRIVADLDNGDYALEGLKIDGTASGDAVPAGKQQFSLGTDLTLDQNAGLLKLSNLTVQAAGIALTGQVDGSDLNGETPRFNGRLTADNLNPRGIMSTLAIEPPATQDSGVLSKASLDARFSATPNAAEIKQLTATLDDTQLDGQASVRDFANPAIAFKLAVDQFNLDRYLPPADEAAGPSEQPSESGNAGGDINAIEIPLEPLRGLNVDGLFSIDSLQASGLSMTDAKLIVRGKPGQPLEQTLTAKLYGGDVRMDNRIAANAATPSYRFQGTLDEILFGDLLVDLMDKNWLGGQGLFNYDLTTAGTTVGDMRRNLSGTVRFGVADGAIKGIDLARVLTAAEARLSGDSANAESGGETRFQRFDGAMTVDKGVARIRELKASSDWANVSASGALNLVDLTIDYTLRPVLSRAPEGADTLSALVGKTVPVTVTGPVTAPKIGIDIKSLLKAEAQQRLDAEKAELRGKAEEEKARLEEKVDKEKERAKEKIRNKLGDFLNRQSKDNSTESEGDQTSGSDAGGS